MFRFHPQTFDRIDEGGQHSTDTAFYLQHCVKACKAGVERSHIIPFAVDGALLLEVYVHDGIGTMVVDEKQRA